MRRLALFATIVLASCGSDDAAEPPAPKAPAPEDRGGVVLTLDRDTPHPGETVTLTVENRTRWRLEYGLMYRLERRIDGEWRWINRDAAFALILKIVEPGKREREQIQVEAQPGRYRIAKSFTAPAADKRFDADVEFTVSGL